MRTTLHRLHRRFAAQRGFALVGAIGVLASLTLAGTATVVYTQQNYGSASRTKADMLARAIAEAGINNALSVLNANDAANPSL